MDVAVEIPFFGLDPIEHRVSHRNHLGALPTPAILFQLAPLHGRSALVVHEPDLHIATHREQRKPITA